MEDLYLEKDMKDLREKRLKAEEQINKLLKEGTPEKYLEVYDLLRTPDIEFCIKDSKALLNLRILSIVEKKLIERGDHYTIFTGRNLYELEELYQELVFRLRRVEFGKQIDIKRDIYGFLVENRLDPEILMAVIKGTVYIYNKDLILKRLTEGIDG